VRLTVALALLASSCVLRRRIISTWFRYSADALNLFIFEDSGYLAVVYLATSAAPSRVFAPTVASAADASALAAPAALPTSLAPSVGAAALVSAGASVAPVLA